MSSTVLTADHIDLLDALLSFDWESEPPPPPIYDAEFILALRAEGDYSTRTLEPPIPANGVVPPPPPEEWNHDSAKAHWVNWDFELGEYV